MKKILFFLSAVLLFQSGIIFAANFPGLENKPQGFMNDFANVISSSAKIEFEQTLSNFEKSTSNEIVVAVVPSLEGMDAFQYAQELFDKWKIGKKNKDNGVLFLIASNEREAFINIGYGLEGVIPDHIAGNILRNEVFPFFKEHDFYTGIKNGLNALMQAAKNEYEPKKENRISSANILFRPWFIIFAIWILSYIGSFLARSKSFWLGGVIGGSGGLIIGVIFFAWIGMLIFAGIFAGLGLIFDYIISKNYQARKAAGKPTDFWHSGGGFWSGGRGGGFGGGGFGGFGGGMSGGGGAGGRW